MRARSQDYFNWHAATESLLFAALGVMFLGKVTSGSLPLYIHPRYTWLIIAAAAVLILIGLSRLWGMWAKYGEGEDTSVLWYLLLACPLVLGIIIPAQPLGAGTLSARSLDDLGPGGVTQSSRWAPPRQQDTTTWTLLDWVTAMSTYRGDPVGKPVDIVGFVYHSAETGQLDQFYIARYVVSCCTADSNGIKLLASWPSSSSLVTNSWVRVHGTIGEIQSNDHSQLGVLATSIEQIAMPPNPYLYP